MPPSSDPKPVIVCADDFALSEAVSLGIARLAAMGRISATSAMVLSPRWTGDAALLRDLRGRIDVGLHLDWTSPLAVAAGHGMSLGRAMLRSLAGGFERARVTAAIERQLDAFEAQWQAAPDHVDGHQHVQQFRGIREPLLDVLDRRYGTGAGPWVRVSQPVGAGTGVKGRVVAAMGARALAAALSQRGRAASPALVGMYGFDGSSAGYAARLAGWLRDAPAGAVLMCHPAARADDADEIGAARLREFECWRGEAASAALAAAHAVPARGPARQPVPGPGAR
ncbi:ChbG/HpnK family deacetylase [Caenimonas terrae]|uniref:ChbG/HpnK family deacetylase n=1 Tax=Caenimonas terrae TaxID=696074 RepID=A0ABW0NHT5_9BURK